MKLIFALGNPEKQYDHTRHNVGFWVADTFTRRNHIVFSEKPKLKAEIADIRVGTERVLIAKPTTYYNLAGESYHAIASFYKIPPENVLIIHDDLALDLGTLRTRVSGSGGGNNGIKSINAHGGDQTLRLRVGIATDMRSIVGDTDFVLGKFSNDEQQILETLQPKIVATINSFIADELEAATHRAA